MIRRAKPDEAETLMRIQREAAVTAFSHVFPPDRYPFPDDEVRAHWESALADPDVEIYVAEIDGEPAGSVGVGSGFLRTLYVLPRHQGSACGRSAATRQSSGHSKAITSDAASTSGAAGA
jgi:hypothetical protein